MRYLILLGLFSMLLIAGCISSPIQPPTQTTEKPKTCRTITEEKPTVKEECSPVSFTETVCGIRKLPYTITHLPKVDICIDDGDCVGKPLGECTSCDKAMTRCVMTIKNDDPHKSGTWTVAANYTLGTGGFNKEPITQTIAPNETFAFDFDQIYTTGSPINSASCLVYVVDEATVEDCYEETKQKSVCRNVTTTATIQREVCE